MDGEDTTLNRAQAEDLNLTPSVQADAFQALDGIFKELGGDQPAEPAAEDKPVDKPADKPVDKPVDKPEDTTPADKPADAAPADKPEDKPADKPEDKPADNAPVDDFEKVELPPHTKPKTGEAFGKVKELARQQVNQLRSELNKIAQEREELQKRIEAQGKTPALSPELEAELKDLREYRLSKDVEYDPEFRKFDSDVKSNNDAILKKLADNGMSKEQLEAIEKLGGPESIDWEPLLPKLPLAVRRFVEAKLVDNVNLRDRRDEALSKAKANATEFTKARETRAATELANHVAKFSDQVDWLKDRKPSATATAEEKAAIAEHNKTSFEFRTRLAGMVKDNSPERFAEYAVCALFATKLSAELKAANDQIEKSKAVAAERDKLKSELEAIRKAEGGRRGGVAHADVPPKKAINTSIHTSAADALDALLAESSRD